MKSKKTIAIILGTRPEAIKLAPLILKLRQETWVDCRVVVTGQHREMLDQVLKFFRIQPDKDLEVMRRAQSLGKLSVHLMSGLNKWLMDNYTDLIIVQGDTTTVAVASYLGFCYKIPIAHVEAGLRTSDRWSPYPEEINRRITSLIATLNFCPSNQAKENLIQEKIEKKSIHVVGNTVIDSLLLTKSKLKMKPQALKNIDFSKKTILITMHRRESFGQPMESICRAISSILTLNSDVQILFPVHKSPSVRKVVFPILEKLKGVHLVEPLDYQAFVFAMSKCYLVMTDSGGVQEEAPSLGKPVIVLREKTERPEAVKAGASILVGTQKKKIINAAQELLNNKITYEMMAQRRNIYGDGTASSKIIKIIKNTLI